MEAIVRPNAAPLNELGRLDTSRIAIAKIDTDIQVVIVVEQPYQGILAGRLPVPGRVLMEILHPHRVPPGPVVQSAIHLWWRLSAGYDEGFPLLCFNLCQCRNRQQQ